VSPSNAPSQREGSKPAGDLRKLACPAFDVERFQTRKERSYFSFLLIFFPKDKSGGQFQTSPGLAGGRTH